MAKCTGLCFSHRQTSDDIAQMASLTKQGLHDGALGFSTSRFYGHIDKQGNVTNVKVLKALPMGLDQAAADAVKKGKFKPATRNGKPVEHTIQYTYRFRLST